MPSDLPSPPLPDPENTSLFLDFDGTLVDLAPTPEAVIVDEGLGPLLERLAAAMPGRVAIVSGRSVAQLDGFLARYLGAVAVAGSHGAERRTPVEGHVLPGNPSVVIHNFPAEWGADRTLQFTNALKKQSKIKVGADITTDASNIVPFTRNAVSDEITQDPDAKAYWFTFDTTGQVGGTVLAAKYKGKSFPDRPLVVTFHGDPATLTLMRQGVIDATSDTNYDAGCWEAVDQEAEFIARHRAESTANQPTYPVIGDPFSYEILTKDNVPPEGQYLKPKWDVPSYFISKWQNEFTNIAK